MIPRCLIFLAKKYIFQCRYRHVNPTTEGSLIKRSLRGLWQRAEEDKIQGSARGGF